MHCSADFNRAISHVSQASPRRTSPASGKSSSGYYLTIAILAETTIVVVEISVDSHVREVGSPTHASKLAIRKLSLSCNKRGVIVFKFTSGDGDGPCILRTGSATLNIFHGRAVTRNGSMVLQRKLIDTASTDVIL